MSQIVIVDCKNKTCNILCVLLIFQQPAPNPSTTQDLSSSSKKTIIAAKKRRPSRRSALSLSPAPAPIDRQSPPVKDQDRAPLPAVPSTSRPTYSPSLSSPISKKRSRPQPSPNAINVPLKRLCLTQDHLEAPLNVLPSPPPPAIHRPRKRKRPGPFPRRHRCIRGPVRYEVEALVYITAAVGNIRHKPSMITYVRASK